MDTFDCGAGTVPFRPTQRCIARGGRARRGPSSRSTRSTSQLDAVFKTVHVLLAVVWVGGGVLLTILAIVADRRNDPHEVATIARQAVFVGEMIFAPAGSWCS